MLSVKQIEEELKNNKKRKKILLAVKETVEKLNKLSTEELDEYMTNLIKQCNKLEEDIQTLKERTPDKVGHPIFGPMNVSTSYIGIGGGAGLLGGSIASMMGHDDKFVPIAIAGMMLGLIGTFLDWDKIAEMQIKGKSEKLYKKLLIKETIENGDTLSF